MPGRICEACGQTVPPDTIRCPSCGNLYAAAIGEEGAQVIAGLERALGPHYRVLDLIGRGGFAMVFRVRDERLDRDVAAKVLIPDFAAVPAVATRFRREAQTAARLSHPGIVPIYFVGAESEIPCFAMPLIEGEPLSARIRREGPLPLAVAISVARDVGAALDFAHAKGVIHRDVKPDNVLMEFASGRSLLADFGIAKALEAHPNVTGTGVALGTPHYMAPEQAEASRTIDLRADVYSLGVVLFEMLAGVPPFHGNSFALMFQHQVAHVPSIHDRRPELSDALDRVLARAMAKEPDERFVTAGDLVRAFEAAAGDKSVRHSGATTIPIQRVDPSQFARLGAPTDPIEAFGTAGDILALSHAAQALETFTIEAAGRAETARVVTALQAATARAADPHVGLRQPARQLLERLGSNQAVADALAARWRDADTREQAVVEGILTSLLPGIAEPLLDVARREKAPELFLLADRVGVLSETVADAAAKQQSPAAARAFVLALRESQRASGAVEKWLVTAARHVHPQVRAAVQEVAAARGGATAERLGRLGATDADPAVRVSAIRALGASRRREAVPDLARVLDVGSRDDQVAAAEALGALGLPEALPVLARVFERKSLFRKERGPVQVAAARAVARLPAPVNHALLATLSADADAAVADIARKALG